jgi:HK97 family phage portal protein
MEIKNVVSHEIKNVSPFVLSQISGQLTGYGGNYLSPPQAYWLWQISDTIGNACDLISWAFEQLEPVLQDKKTKDYVDDHPLIELINNPGFKMTSDRFQFELMTSFLVTGECYPILEGNVNYEPFGIYTLGSNYTSLQEAADGWLGQIIINQNRQDEVYSREEIPKRRMWVYQHSTKLKETVQILNKTRRNALRAQSVLERVYYQALTKYYGNVHNSALLKNPGRLSGTMSPKAALNQDAWEAFQNEARNTIEGPQNAGRMLYPPAPVEFINHMLNPRDMDFINLIENSREEIHSQYQIPLPLVTTKTMTMGNYENAVYAFYDMAVMPRAKFLYKQLGKFALPRYKDGDRYDLVINEKEIPALKERLFKIVKEVRATSAFSENEMRSIAGYADLGDEGDQIWKPSNLIPSGEVDDMMLDNIVQRVREEEQQRETEEDVAEEEE